MLGACTNNTVSSTNLALLYYFYYIQIGSLYCMRELDIDSITAVLKLVMPKRNAARQIKCTMVYIKVLSVEEFFHCWG